MITTRNPDVQDIMRGLTESPSLKTILPKKYCFSLKFIAFLLPPYKGKKMHIYVKHINY